MNLPALSIRNHRFVQVMIGLLVGLGLLSFFTMPRTEDPVFDLPTATVVVVFPGADAEVVEALAVDPIEEELDELEDLLTLESSVQNGVAVIDVEMIAGTDADDTYDDVLQKVNGILDDLPDEIRSVDVIKPSLSDVTVLQLALHSTDAPVAELRTTAEWLEAEIRAVGGVKRVDIQGLPDPQVRVNLDPERMRALGISVDRVAAAVQASEADIPGGFVVAGERRLNVRTSGDFETLEEIRRTAIPTADGRLVRIEDLAEVVHATEDVEELARFQGEPVVFLSVIQREGTNIFDVLGEVKAVLAEAEGALPPGTSLLTVFDQSVSVASRVNGFFSSLIQGIALVGVMMLLFVGFRPALLVMLTIPLAILLAVAGVDWTGFGLQQMTIVGLVIALGLLVDDAIVVVENIGRLRREGMPPLQAALEGATEVAWPSTSGTVTTVLAFVPMVALSGGTGSYVRSLPVTVIYALVGSLFLSLTLTPLLASRMTGRKGGKGRRSEGAAAEVGTVEAGEPAEVGGSEEPDPTPGRAGLLDPFLQRVAAGPYRRLLDGAVRRPGRAVAVAVLSLVVALGLFPLVGVSLFPKAEKPQFLVNVETPEGTSLAATARVVAALEETLDARDDVVLHSSNVGVDNPRVYYNVTPRPARSNIGQLLVELDRYGSADSAVAQLSREFDRVPGARITITEFENGPPVEAPIVFKITGPDLETLQRLSTQVEEALEATPGTRDVRNPLAVRASDLQVVLQRDRLALLGLDPLDVDRTVRASVAGLEVGTFREVDGTESDVVLRFPFVDRDATPADLERVTLLTPAGATVPLAQVASLEFTPTTGRIDHYATRRVATVTAFPEGDASVLEITDAVSAELGAIPWPPGYDWFAGGTFQEQQAGFAAMLRALIVAVLGIFAVLVLQFRSYVQPLIIFAAVPVAFVGAVGALLITGYTFSFTAFIGITSLVGIVVNNSIILVDYANRRMAAGDSVEEALRRAGETRFRPIVLTTVTTISGLLPLTLSGSTLWSPLGWTIIGGLITSTALSLVLVPALYRVVYRVTEPRVVVREVAAVPA